MSDAQEFQAATGQPAPASIWLIAMACGEVAWNQHPDPDGEGEPSVGYVLTTRLAAVEAERDAAVAKLARTDDACKHAIAAAGKVGILEGERRATAAIVAWLRGVNHAAGGLAPGLWRDGADSAIASAVNAIERGDHLPSNAP